MFRCEADGFESIVFGSFDGVTSWTTHTHHTLGPLHQEMVSAHEEHHFRLQKGTPWGALLMLHGMAPNIDPSWTELVDACRHTHETYATWSSTARVDGGLTTIAGNVAYLDYWRTGATIAAVFDEGDPITTIVDYLFHLLMSPSELANAHFGGDHTHLLPHSPDVRLGQLQELLEENETLVEQIRTLIRAGADTGDIQDELAPLLTAAGLRTLSTAGQLREATRLMEEFNLVAADHEAFVVDRTAETKVDSVLDYQQHERLQLHPHPVTLELFDPNNERSEHPLTRFLVRDVDLGPHVWAVILSRRVLEHQFDVGFGLDTNRCWGLLGVDRVDSSTGWLWPLSDSPAEVTTTLGRQGVQSVVMTTMSTLADSFTPTHFSPDTPVFVLIDIPLPQYFDLIRREGGAKWVHAETDGDRVLHLVVLVGVNGAQSINHVIIRSANTVKATVEWLRRAPEFSFAPSVADRLTPHLSALANRIAGSFVAADTTPLRHAPVLPSPATGQPRAEVGWQRDDQDAELTDRQRHARRRDRGAGALD